MSVRLNRDTIKKLTHESAEIRLRTLEQISGKLERALAHNENIDFKPSELCKQLIRWFGFQPIQKPHIALGLLLKILRSPYAQEAVEKLGKMRFDKEMDKVEKILQNHASNNELELVKEIQCILLQYRRNTDAIVELMDSITISDVEKETEQQHGDYAVDVIEYVGISDYEVPWSKPTVADYNALKFIADIFVNNFASYVEIQNALQHLQITMSDYPVEYMLQAPNIFLKLLQLYEEADQKNCPLDDVIATFMVFIKFIRERLRLRCRSIAFSASAMPTLVQPKTQLKLEKVVELLMEKNIAKLEAIVLEFCNEISQILHMIYELLQVYKQLQLCVQSKHIVALHGLCEKLTKCIQHDEHFTLHRIKYMIIAFLLQSIATNNAKRAPLLDTHMYEAFLHDYTMKLNFPKRYETLKKLLCDADTTLGKRYECLQECEQSYDFALKMLRSPTSSKDVSIIERGLEICLALEKLQSFKLLEMLFDAIVEYVPQYPTQMALKSKAIDLLMQLVHLNHEPLQMLAYNKIAHAIKRHIGCLMNCEPLCCGVSNGKLLDAQIIGVPLCAELLQEIIYRWHDTVNEQIKQNCEDILCILLKSQHLLGDHWSKLLEILLPLVPLLQCCTSSQKITENLLKLLDPDAHNLPYLSVLQGNVCYLLHPDAQIRSEAITRLIYMLNTLPEASSYMPNIMEINDLLPNDVCIQTMPREYANIFATSQYFQEQATLQNLLLLLETRDIEPLIRKTTLMQLNVMCQSWPMCVSFCMEDAHYIVLQTLEASLQTTSSEVYVDTAIPVVGILSKVLFCDADFRRELATSSNIYVLLLRTIFLYHTDIQVLQDVSTCLFQLLFAQQLMVHANESLQVPSIITNLRLPVKCSPLYMTQNAQGCIMKASIFANAREELLYLRQLIATQCCGSTVDATFLETQKQYDYSSELYLTQRDWRIMKATNPLHNIKRFLRAISNATEHRALVSAMISLKLQMQLQYFNDTGTEIGGVAQDLLRLFDKYLQLPPGSEMDMLLYEHILDLCDTCVCLRIPKIAEGVLKSIRTDRQHACIALLKNAEIPLRLYHKLSTFLQHLFHTAERAGDFDERIFHTQLFESFFEMGFGLFDHRDLQRVRCLLCLMQTVTVGDKSLEMSDKSLYSYCKRFIHLSIALKSTSTQTGAQWHRDCLRIVCQLHAQMQEASTFHLNTTVSSRTHNTLRYLSGMCGHNDAQVRALAWCVLAQYVRVDTPPLSSYIDFVFNELSYLPGGFLACCLCTLLDSAEVVMVRQLAGNLFVDLIALMPGSEQSSSNIIELLDTHDFWRVAVTSLDTCILEKYLPLYFNYETNAETANSCTISTCEIISCFCRICIRLAQLSSANFMDVFCEKKLAFKLYELLKLPTAYDNPAYYTMCSDICQLYAMFYDEHNFIQLQRTLCRDQVWLMSFCQLLNPPSTLGMRVEKELVNILQLLLVLCKDATAHGKLLEKIASAPKFLIKLFLRAFTIPRLNTSLQRCSLAVLTLLLAKSQHANGEGEYSESSFIHHVIGKCTDVSEHETNTLKSITPPPRTVSPPQLSIRSAKSAENLGTSAAARIFIELQRIFAHLCPTKSCKFDQSPSVTKVQVAEAIALLLKLSPQAQAAADNLRFLEKLLRVLQTFIDEFQMSCTTYVRRYGETKKTAIIRNLQLIFNILLNWYSAPRLVLTDELQALQLSKVLIQIWPWLVHSNDLRYLVLQVCAFLSERSIVVCTQFSTLISTYAHSILHLVLKIAIAETNRAKTINSAGTIDIALRIIMNCCVCADGRVTLVKMHVLDVFDGLHPFNLKSPKMKMEILHSWLLFWELYSRYAEGAQARNLNALCSLISQTPACSTTRLITLKILRNMCFLPNNRTALLASTDFVYTVNEIVSTQMLDTAMSGVTTETASCEEQYLVCVALWKLISAGVKYVALIRGTKLAKRLFILREQLDTLEAEDFCGFKRIPFATDLTNVLDIIVHIFKQ